MFPIDPSFREKKVLPQRGSRKYWFSSASYATIEPRSQKRPKPDCGIATFHHAYCDYFTSPSEAAKARLRDCNMSWAAYELANTMESEPANARLRDCNISYHRSEEHT